MKRLTTDKLVKGNEYLFTDYPTQHAYRAIYLGKTQDHPECPDYNIHEFRIFPRTICLNKPFTMRLLEIDVNKTPDIDFTEIDPNSHWN